MKITKSNAPKILSAMRASGVLTECRTYNSGGKGGQHGNRSFNALALTGQWNVCDLDGEFLEVVTVSASAECKSQHDSRRAALVLLCARLRERVAEIRAAARGERRVESASFGGGGEKRVRTYHEPDDRVTDGTGFQMSYRRTAGAGKIAALIDCRRDRMIADA